MSTIALTEAVRWTGELMDAEFKGRGDREKSARHRLSNNTGVPESYIFRLTYKAREMGDVKGEWYRLLKEYYDGWCAANEAAADQYEAERLRIEEKHEAHPSNLAAAARVAEAPQSAKEA